MSYNHRYNQRIAVRNRLSIKMLIGIYFSKFVLATNFTTMTPEEAELIKEGMKITNGWLEKAFGPAVEQAGGMLGDWLEDKRKVLQYNRQVVAHKVKTIMIEENVTPKEISSKVLFPLLEGISLEDDETLQDMWANLIVNYIDSEQTLRITVYPGILKQLSSQEVNILQQLSEENGEAVSFELFM